MKIQLGQKEIEMAIRNYVREKIPGLPKDATVEIYTEHYGDTMCIIGELCADIFFDGVMEDARVSEEE